ncbi:MAG: CDP-alcohol phosphatidyltransferase family protein [Ignavibacteria bacterium]|nr:CDP-alcohol phosphatidyltransferase family protein [Ignavibacteria bacterium]
MSDQPSGSETDLPHRFLTLSNILSLCRMFLSVPFVLVMFPPSPGGRIWGGAIMAVAALTDWLDGYVARRLHQRSEWGKILDPLADKVAVLSVLVTLLLIGDLPLWYAALGISRDLMIAAGGIFIQKKYGLLLASNELGKWTVGSIALVLFLLTIGAQGVYVQGLLLLSAAMMLLSVVSYAKRAAAIVGNREV